MSKRIVDIPDRTYDFIMGLNQHTFGSKYAHKDVQADVVKAVKESKPYDDSGDLISREALKEEVRKHAEYYADRTKEDRYNVGYTECACEILDFIDNAPTVEHICPYLSDNEIKQPCLNSPCERPQGECISREYIEGIVEELENICQNAPEEVIELLSNIKNAPTVTVETAPETDVCAREIFNGICPYTNIKCEKWTCSVCEVEKRERRLMEGDTE